MAIEIYDMPLDKAIKKIMEMIEGESLALAKFTHKLFKRAEFPKEFSQRLLELFIMEKICKSSFKDKLEGKNNRNSKGPDFKINNFFNEKNLYIECVCPKSAIKTFKDGDFKTEETVIKDSTSISVSHSGIDDHSVTRFTSVLKYKYEKFNSYLEEGLVKQEDYKMICILGYEVAQAKKRTYDIQHTFTIHDFELAINGKIGFLVEEGKENTAELKQSEYKIKKPNNTILEVGGQKYLNIFDVIVFCDNFLPFFTPSGCTFYFYITNPNSIELTKLLSVQELFI